MEFDWSFSLKVGYRETLGSNSEALAARATLSHPHPQFKSLLSRFDSRVVKGELVLSDDGPTVLVTRVCDHVKVGRPHLKLPLPVDDGGERSADQEGTLGVALREVTISGQHRQHK